MNDVVDANATRLVRAVQELSEARTHEQVQEIVTRSARELAHADGATLVLADGDQCHYIAENAIAPLWKGQKFPQSACVSGWVMQNAVPVAIPDVFADPRVPGDVYRSTFVKSLLMVPIRPNSPVGAVGAYWADHHIPNDVENRTIQALADSASIALENIRLYGELVLRAEETSLALDKMRTAEAERATVAATLKRTEEQFRQAQKMDAVGKLAGGIAHDFNNLLSVILSFSAMGLKDLQYGDPLREYLDEIHRAGERAAGLTRQLLAFSRQQVFELQTIALEEVVQSMERMFRRLIGEDIDLSVLVRGKPTSVLADRSQLEQVVLNLVVNARDAMPRGGKLTIEVSNTELDEEYAATHFDVRPGSYVMLAVSDTGVGIPKDVQARIFEPFFTTKPAGKGTGLGLATVYGIVKQLDGHVWVYSEVDKGTTFKVYIAPKRGREARLTPAREIQRLTGTETILVVEDDDQVRAVTRGIARKGGYHVLEASNAGEAILHCEQHPQRIHLLLTDVVMPQLSGVQLAGRLLKLRPEMAVLCMSGYSDEAAVHHGLIDSGMAFIQKPFTPDSLLAKIRATLDAARIEAIRQG